MTQEEKDAAILEAVKQSARKLCDEMFEAKLGQNSEIAKTMEAFKGFQSKLTECKTQEAVEALKGGAAFQELKDSVATLKATLEKMGKKGKKVNKNFNHSLREGLKAFHKNGQLAALKANPNHAGLRIFTSKTTTNDAGIKVDNPMSDATSVVPVSSNGAPFEIAQFMPGLTRVTRRKPFILDLVSVFRTMDKFIVWVEQTNIDTGVAFTTAEGASQSGNYGSFRFSEYTIQTQKITALSKATREIMDDLQEFQRQVEEEIFTLMKLKLDSQVLSGSGSGANLKGITQYAQSFVNNGNLQVSAPNNYDAILAAILQIETNGTASGISGGGEIINIFTPTDIVMHPADVAQMDLTKDTLNRYILDQMSYPEADEGGKRIAGLRVTENIGITQGKVLVMDATKSHVAIRQDAEFMLGYVGNDFQDDLITLKGLIRAAHFIKGVETNAFVYDSFANIKAAIAVA